MCRPIGGYYSLELSKSEEFHKNAIKLNTGRNCLEYILRARGYKKVYIPYYTCEVILEPFDKTRTEYVFYHIDDNFELNDNICLKQGEAILYTNYFGLKQRYVETLARKYGQRLIVDNTQAFYAYPVAGIDTFYSGRKFFGVPDGAYLYTNAVLDIAFERDISWNRMNFLTKRIDLGAKNGYDDFRDVSRSLIMSPIKKMSLLTESLMRGINYNEIKQIRRNNYLFLHKNLRETNCLEFELEEDAVPMVYPYWGDGNKQRDYLIENKIFVAKYWPNVASCVGGCTSIEIDIANNLLPIPCDQRYGQAEMQTIINVLYRYEK